MADSEVAAETPKAPKSPKKSKTAAGKAKKAKASASHPKISVMVDAAITNLKDRKGSSLPAIKKYISTNYKVDMTKLTPFIRKYLKSSVASGSLVQTKGKGASGSFKLGGGSTKSEKPSKAKAPKKATVAKVAKAKKVSVKKVKKPKAKAEKKSKPAKSPKKPKVKSAAKQKVKKAKVTPKKSSKKGKK